MKIGILTSGGDCAGLNAVIRGIGLSALNTVKGAEVYGIPDGYSGLIEGKCFQMKRKDFDGLLTQGGTVLGTSRQPNKFMREPFREDKSRLDLMVANYKKMGFDCIFTLGGAGTHKNANLLAGEGCNVIALPKTIDNDVFGTDVTFGFQSAVEVAAESIGRMRTTAQSHGRVMLAEIMGNKVGWLTLHSGIAGGADMILIPEIPFSLDEVCAFVSGQLSSGKKSLIIAVAEGAVLDSEAAFKKSQRTFTRTELGEMTVVPHLAEEIASRTGAETRSTVLGYVQRGGEPCAYDRVLCTRIGEYAVRLLKENKFGVTVAVKGDELTYNSLSDIAGKYKRVDPDGSLVATARNIGISFGDRTTQVR